MTVISTATSAEAVSSPPPQIPEKLRALAADKAYEAPRVVTFPIDAMSITEALAFTGNT